MRFVSKWRFKHLRKLVAANSVFQDIKTRPLPYIIFALIFGIVGPLLLLASHASAPVGDSEAESGTLSGCSTKFTDSSSSGNQGIKLGGCYDISTPTNLLADGSNTPQTQYAIPSSKVIYMATNGDDSKDGTTKATAVKTLNIAIGLVPSGGTIVVRGGVYRDWYHDTYTATGPAATWEEPSTIRKPVTIQSYPHEHVWFDGTDDYTNGLGCSTACNWKNNGTGQYTMTWSTPSFCDSRYYTQPFVTPQGSPMNSPGNNKGPCAYWDSVMKDSGLQYHDGTDGNPKTVIQSNYDKTADGANNTQQYRNGDEIYLVNKTAIGDPQMIFKDHVAVPEVLCSSDITTLPASSFCYQENLSGRTGKLILGFNPGSDSSRHVIEVADKPSVFSLGAGSADGSIIRGIGFRHYASDTFETSGDRGTIMTYAADTRFENDVFFENAGNGLGGSKSGVRATIIHNVFAHNGKVGLQWNGTGSGSNPNDMQVLNNVFNYSNQENFDRGCSQSCTAAGSKTAHMWNITYKNNIVTNTVGQAIGLWCDLRCTGGTYVNNLIHDNGGEGIRYEVSNKGILASNLIYGNGDDGIVIKSANTQIYNNTLVDNSSHELNIFDDPRSPSTDSDVGPDTTNISVFNNIMVDTTDNPNLLGLFRAGGTKPAPNTTPDQFFNDNTSFDYNSYFRYSNDACWRATPACTKAPNQTIANWATLDSSNKIVTKNYKLMDDGSTPGTGYRDGTKTQGNRIDEHSSYSNDHSVDPFFTDATNHKYTLKPGSSAASGSAPIPNAVACVINLLPLSPDGSCPLTTPVPGNQHRGALHWPGN